MKPDTNQRHDLTTGPDQGAPGDGHGPEFESDQHAEWRINDGGVFRLRLDRTTGAWSGERVLGDGDGANVLSSHEVSLMARAHNLRFRDGTQAG
jgi:hypothetical protein